ncbi:MAG: hypothetical protein MZV63_02930 [Marinilabiliales bacterium]|nr:hypothetical protein [Marinilabiliales bacterium]
MRLSSPSDSTTTIIFRPYLRAVIISPACIRIPPSPVMHTTGAGHGLRSAAAIGGRAEPESHR